MRNEWIELKLTIPGTPVAWARVDGKAHRFTPAKQRRYKETVKGFAFLEWGRIEPGTGPIILHADFYFPFPKRTPKRDQKEHAFKATKPDLDNLVKLVKDALEGVAYTNDSQVCAVFAQKLFTLGEPCTKIILQRPDEC